MNKLYLDACYYADTTSNMFNLYNTPAEKEGEEITGWTSLNLIVTTKHLKHDKCAIFYCLTDSDRQKKYMIKFHQQESFDLRLVVWRHVCCFVCIWQYCSYSFFSFSSTCPRKYINYKARNQYTEHRCNIAVICRGFKMKLVTVVLLVQVLVEPSRHR